MYRYRFKLKRPKKVQTLTTRLVDVWNLERNDSSVYIGSSRMTRTVQTSTTWTTEEHLVHPTERRPRIGIGGRNEGRSTTESVSSATSETPRPDTGSFSAQIEDPRIGNFQIGFNYPLSSVNLVLIILVYLVAMVSGAVYYRRRRTRKTRHSGPNFRSWRAKKDKCSDESDAEEGGQARWSSPVPQAPVITQPVKDEGARPKLILPQRLFLSEPFSLPKAPTDYSLELGKINGKYQDEIKSHQESPNWPSLTRNTSVIYHLNEEDEINEEDDKVSKKARWSRKNIPCVDYLEEGDSKV